MIITHTGVGPNGMTECPRCETEMHYNDETTKLVEYACPNCHRTRIVHKESFRVTA
jgi:transposase-like protein